MAEETFETMVRAAAELRRAGRVPEAIAAYREVLARWPDKPDSWYNLALLQRHAGDFDAALESYQQALDRGVSQPEEVHLNRGVIYSDCLRRDDAAEAEINAALKLNPAYLPAIVNLGNLHEDRGQRDKAAAMYQRALANDPNCHTALARLANLHNASGPGDPFAARLRQAIAHPTASPVHRALLGFALGRMLDQCGAYDAAFLAFEGANRAGREGVDPSVPRYDRALFERQVGDVIATFTPELFRAVQGSASSPALFVCGMFRSGSSLVEQVLASHPRVTGGGELNLVPDIATGALAPFPESVAGASREQIAQLASGYGAAIEKMFPAADLVTDKRPDNVLFLGLIKLMFPDAKIVHTFRNGLDNCLSIYFLYLDARMVYAHDLMDIGHYYGQYRRLMAHWKSLFGADILDFDYDTFVREPRPAAEQLLRHCGLDWDERVLSFYETPSTVKTASVWQVREPLYTRSSGRARHYERQLAPLRMYLQGRGAP
jgi:tetratricopeptide (TPR) repeat protein